MRKPKVCHLMRLYSGKIPTIAADIVHKLVDAGDIETESPAEVELDVEAILKEYLRLDQELTEAAKDLMERRGMSYSQFGRVKRSLAEQKDFGIGEEALTWIVNQLVETFMHSANVEEVFADDLKLRRTMKDILRKHMAIDEDIDLEVRQRIRNMEEGTAAWELEYNKVLEQIKRKRGLGQS